MSAAKEFLRPSKARQYTFTYVYCYDAYTLGAS